MNGRLLIIFKSNHGYTKRYVDILGNALGCDAVPVDKLKGNMLACYDRFLYIGSIRGTSINGFKKMTDYLDVLYDKLAVCGVGMLPYSKSIPEQLREGSISVAYEKFIPVFYAQGGFDASELTRTEAIAVSMTVKQIKTQSLITENETFMLNAVKQPVDEVKQANIQPLIDYLEGKQPDESLYSPAEITDPEEQKKYMAEAEAQTVEPENKKRSIKKKLKK